MLYLFNTYKILIIIYCHVLVTDDNGLLISKEGQPARELGDHFNGGSEFQLCSGENLCPDSSNDCFKFEICVADSVRSPSKIRYDSVHK